MLKYDLGVKVRKRKCIVYYQEKGALGKSMNLNYNRKKET